MKRKPKRLLLWISLLLLAAYLALPTATPPSPPPAAITSGELQVVFFDVGQGDCALISTAGQHMLIDAGNIGQDELVLGYLAEYGVKSLDYLVATHPHADHIGAMASVIYDMDEIGQVLMPEATHTTKTFENLLAALEERELQITVPQPGDIFNLGEASIQVLAPAGEYEELNDYSLVLRVSFGNTVFLFTGDAEAISEKEQLAAGAALRADVLKVGHHGSSSSTTKAYLQAVNPDYAVISCGQDNNYGHPHTETIEKLTQAGVPICRTDQMGSIVFTTDGQILTLEGK